MKEGIIKSVSEGNRILEHTRYRSALGLLEDMFDLVEIKEDGHKIHHPMFPPIKSAHYTKETPIDEMGCNEYTDEEMLQVLRGTKP